MLEVWNFYVRSLLLNISCMAICWHIQYLMFGFRTKKWFVNLFLYTTFKIMIVNGVVRFVIAGKFLKKLRGFEPKHRKIWWIVTGGYIF